MRLRRRLAFHQRVQHFCREFAFVDVVGRDACERRAGELAQKLIVVDADYRKLFGDRDASVVCRGNHMGGPQVVHRHHCRRLRQGRKPPAEGGDVRRRAVDELVLLICPDIAACAKSAAEPLLPQNRAVVPDMASHEPERGEQPRRKKLPRRRKADLHVVVPHEREVAHPPAKPGLPCADDDQRDLRVGQHGGKRLRRDYSVGPLGVRQRQRILTALAVCDHDVPEGVPLCVAAYAEQNVALGGEQQLQIYPDSPYFTFLRHRRFSSPFCRY